MQNGDLYHVVLKFPLATAFNSTSLISIAPILTTRIFLSGSLTIRSKASETNRKISKYLNKQYYIDTKTIHFNFALICFTFRQTKQRLIHT